MSKNYTYEVDSKSDLIEVSVKVEKALYEKHYEDAVKNLSADVKIPGFRPGKAPRAKVEAKLGSQILSETVRTLFPEVAAQIVDENEWNPVTQLDYDLQKFSDTEVEFKFSFTNYPEVKIPKLNSLKVEVDNSTEVEDKEIEDVIQRLYENENPEAKEDFDIKKLTAEDIKSWDIDGAKNIDELKEKISERLVEVKQTQIDRQLESKILEALVEKSTFSIPEGLLKAQTEDLMHQYLHRIDDLDISREDFLAAQGLTEEALREQKQEEAERRVSVDLVLNQVAKDHDLIPSAEEIDEQIEAIPDEQTKTQMDTFSGRRYIMTTLLQSNALKKLKEEVKVESKKVEKKSSKESKPKSTKKKKATAKK